MKKRFLSMLVLLMIAVTSAWAQEKVAYAVWDSDATTLTFKYDANMPTSNAWEINTGTTRPGWYSKRSSVTKVVFDASFADARPTSFYYWFYGCGNLTSIEGETNLNASEVTNSDRMFYNCSSLASVTLPDGLTTIGTYAFRSCSSLTSVTLPAGLTTIGTYAFQNCYSLTSVNIPESVTTVGNYAFQNCSSLAEPLYSSKLFVFMPTSKEGTYDVPDGITEIAPYAFRNCYYLTKITIPESVTSIGEYNQEIKGVTNVEIIPVSA